MLIRRLCFFPLCSHAFNHLLTYSLPPPPPSLPHQVGTDIVDGGRPTHEEFMENLGTAAASLQQALPKCLGFIEGKAVAEL